MDAIYIIRLISMVAAVFSSAVAVGCTDVAFLLLMSIRLKMWPYWRTVIATIFVPVFSLLVFRGYNISNCVPMPHMNLSTLHGNITTTKNETEIFIDSQMQSINCNLAELNGIFVAGLLTYFTLPGSTRVNIFLVEIGLSVGDTDIMTINEHKLQMNVLSILIMPFVSIIFSFAMTIIMRKFVKSKNKNVIFFFITFILAAGYTMAFLNIVIKEKIQKYLPMWLKVLLMVVVATLILVCEKMCMHCNICKKANAEEEDEQELHLVKATELDISHITSCIRRKNWEQCMHSLDMSNEDIEEMKQNYPYDSKEQIYRCLRRWQEKYPEKATVKYLERKLPEEYFDRRKFHSSQKDDETEGGSGQTNITTKISQNRYEERFQDQHVLFLLKLQCVCGVLTHGTVSIGLVLDHSISTFILLTDIDTLLCEVIIVVILIIGVFVGVGYGRRLVDNVCDGGLCDITPLSYVGIESGFSLATFIAVAVGMPIGFTMWKMISLATVGTLLTKHKLTILLVKIVSSMICFGAIAFGIGLIGALSL